MYLTILIGIVLFISSTFAKECPSFRDGSQFSTHSVKIDDVLFHVHYPNQRTEFKQKVVEVLLKDAPSIHHYFSYRPKTEVHLIIQGNSADSNGLATVFPYNQITLNDFSPIGFNYLAKTSDWIRNLVIHEYVHIVTMDMTNGWIDYFRNVFGSSVKTNGILPRWLIEGVAVWYESLEAGSGRLNQPEVKFQIYQALQDSTFCQSLDCLDRPMSYPYGHAPYWIGGGFVKFLEDRQVGTLKCLFQAHSDQVPFFLNQVVRECTGEDIFVLYEKFKTNILNSPDVYSCPYPNKFCEKINKANIKLTTIDFQTGFCEQGSELAFIERKEKGLNRFATANQMTILNTQNSAIKFESFDYPIEMVYSEGNKCIVKQSAVKGCQNEFILETIDLNSTQKANVENISLTPGIIPKKKDDLPGNYQAHNYMKPEFLLVDYSNFANLSAYNLKTSLTDPLRIHNLTLGATLYETPSRDYLGAGNLGYLYGTNAWQYSFDVGKFYYYSELIQEVADTSYTSSSASYLHGEKSWKNKSSLIVNEQKSQDFISTRKTQTLIFDQNFVNINNNLNRKMQNLNINYRISANRSLEPITTDFWGGEFHLSQSFFTGKWSTVGYNLRHGKLLKDELVSGHVKAGGMNSYLANGYRYPLYMIYYGDLLGNEITTGNIYYNTIVFNHYKGSGLLPFYIKDSGLQTGLEYAKGKYLFSEDELFKNEYASGVYLKYYLNMTLFYLWDSTFSLAISKMNYPTSSTKLLFLFDATAF